MWSHATASQAKSPPYFVCMPVLASYAWCRRKAEFVTQLRKLFRISQTHLISRGNLHDCNVNTGVQPPGLNIYEAVYKCRIVKLCRKITSRSALCHANTAYHDHHHNGSSDEDGGHNSIRPGKRLESYYQSDIKRCWLLKRHVEFNIYNEGRVVSEEVRQRGCK
ncbi:uncharacterized protein V6R79_017383 [Siganus canaliculatus]